MKDLTGNVYGKLTVLALHGTRPYPGGGSRRLWLCKCECGDETTVAGNNLTGGHTTSCGSKKHMKNYHGITNTPIYDAWQNMLARCTKMQNPSWKDYGGRGITVCREWFEFKPFYEAMSSTWREGLVLDRRDNDAGYCPENCRWITPAESLLNRRNTLRWEHNGQSLTATEWSRGSAFSPRLVRSRLQMGWSVPEAISRPVRAHA